MHALATRIRTLGLAAFLFFLVKGLVWLGILLAPIVFATRG